MRAAPPPSVDDLVRSPAWLPLGSAAPAHLRLVQLDEAAYRAASFLDERLLAAGRAQAEVPATTVAAAAARLRAGAERQAGAHFIFHTGHVGSTLIARLLGEHPALFVLREPALLRELAAPPGGAAGAAGAASTASAPGAAGALGLDAALALLARTWRASQRAVVKATSFVSELAAPILGAPARPHAVCVYAAPGAYLATILAGPASRAETRELAPLRVARLARRLGCAQEALGVRSEGEWIAMSWLCELTALVDAAAGCAERVLWADFDAFLAAPAEGLARLCAFLGASITPAGAEAIASGPLMHRYSKATEYPYDAQLRRELLDGAAAEHAAQVRAGMEWLRAAAGRHRLAALALERVTRAPAAR